MKTDASSFPENVRRPGIPNPKVIILENIGAKKNLSEWRNCKLGDIATLHYGKALRADRRAEGNIPVYSSAGITGNHDVALVNNCGLIVGRKGTVGKVYHSINSFWCIDTAYFILPDESKYDFKFLYFLLQTLGLEELNEDSAVPGLNRETAYQQLLCLPPLHEQRAIAAVLSSLDDKIDLLHRQNKTLEAMAETLFRQWFVEEAGEDWELVELGRYVECFNGVSYKSDNLVPSTTAMVTLKNFDRDGGFRLDGFKEFEGRYKEQHVVQQGDLVVAHTDITQDAEVIGNPILVVSNPTYLKLVISMDLVKVVPKIEWLSKEFLYQMMRTREFKQHCLGYSNGSTVLHLNKEAIPSYELFLPPKVTIEEFTNAAKGLLGKKFKNITQIRTLEKLRDTLLPKLMSGEVRVTV